MKSQTIITIAQKPLINTKFKAFIHCRQFSSFIIEFPLIFTFIYNSFFLHFISFPGLASVSEISKKKKNWKKKTHLDKLLTCQNDPLVIMYTLLITG